MACAFYRYERHEELPFRVAAQHVAIGRLGKIFPALDKLSMEAWGHSGRVITVESIPLRRPSSNSSREDGDDDDGGDPFALIEQTLMLELNTQAGAAIRTHRHIVSYDALHCVTQNRHVFLHANVAPARLISTLLVDFGKLHPLVVNNYIRGVVSALSVLHESGVVIGGISSSSILISSDGRAQLIAHFPSTRAIRVLLDSKVLESDRIPCRVLSRQNLDDGDAQDARSVAYVMTEMLTGMRVRGHLLEREHLLSHVACKSLESQFLGELLSETSSLASVVTHPYIYDHRDNVEPFMDQFQLRDDDQLVHQQQQPSLAEKEQRVIAMLVEQELLKCKDQRRRHLGEIRVWLAQFERRNERKPTPSERPKSVTQLQHRCRALLDRMKELEMRLSSSRKSFYRKSESMERDENDDQERDARLDDSSSPSFFIGSESSSHGSKLGVLPAIDVSIREGDLSRDGFKRSPAQNAFLKRLGPQAVGEKLTGEHTEVNFVSNREQQVNASVSIVSDRANGHQIIHQRKEVMQVINTIAASTTNSPH